MRVEHFQRSDGGPEVPHSEDGAQCWKFFHFLFFFFFCLEWLWVFGNRLQVLHPLCCNQLCFDDYVACCKLGEMVLITVNKNKWISVNMGK